MASFSFANNRVKMASAARSLKIIISADRWWSASGFIIFLFFCFFFLASLCAPRGLEELNAANSIRTVNSSPSQLACSGLRQRSVKAERRREREREREREQIFSNVVAMGRRCLANVGDRFPVKLQVTRERTSGAIGPGRSVCSLASATETCSPSSPLPISSFFFSPPFSP